MTTSEHGDATAQTDEVRRLYRRTLRVVVAAQVFGGAGLAAGVTVGALLAQDLLGGTGLAGMPAALMTLGAAATAFLVGRTTQRLGRRVGLVGGFFAGTLGAAGVVVAALVENVPLLFASLLVYGAGNATNLQARYAGTDLAHPDQRATAVSLAMVSTTVGAVAGPMLVEPTGVVAEGLGLPALTGPFLLAGLAFAVAGAVLLVWLRPDPFLVARRLAGVPEAPRVRGGEATGADDGVRAAERAGAAVGSKDATTGADAPVDEAAATTRGVAVGTTVMVLTQMAMVAIMTMTPVHMRAHGHGLGEVGVVIGVHVGAMYLPSLVTGRLVDRLGRTTMSVVAAVVLLAAGLTAATSPDDSMAQLLVALALLGVGWNIGLIAGTAMLVDATPLATRASTQGSVDVLVALSGATGGALSGAVMAGTSYATLSLAGGVLSLLLVPVVVWAARGRVVSDEARRTTSAE